MQKNKKLLWSLSTILLSTANFASVHFLVVIWKLNLYLYVFLIIIVSCIISALTVSMEGAVKHTFISLLLGVSVALGVLIAPSIVYERDITEINAVFVSSASIIAKFLLIGLVFCIIGIVIGWYLIEVSSEF